MEIETSTFAFKDEKLEHARKSSFIATCAMQLVFDSIRHNIISRKEIVCDVMSAEISIFLSQLRYVNLFSNDSHDISLSCPAMIKGGDDYRFKKTNDSPYTGFDLFQCSIDIIYNDQRSVYTRTLLVNPPRIVKENYNYLLSIENELLNQLKPGAELGKVFEAVISFAEQKNSTLAKYLKKNFGILLAPDSCDRCIFITSKSRMILKEKMVFALNFELHRLEVDDRKYSLIHGDTVFVRHEKPALILTVHKGKYQNFMYETEALSNVKDNYSDVRELRRYFSVVKS